MNPEPVYYHGTTVPNVTHILPASHHDGPVTFPEWTSIEHAYATTSLDGAWKYAHHSREANGHGEPRVYQVRPIDGHEHVEKDPEWDHEQNVSRNLYGGEHRSKRGWEVVQEVSRGHVGNPPKTSRRRGKPMTTLAHGHSAIPHAYVTATDPAPAETTTLAHGHGDISHAYVTGGTSHTAGYADYLRDVWHGKADDETDPTRAQFMRETGDRSHQRQQEDEHYQVGESWPDPHVGWVRTEELGRFREHAGRQHSGSPQTVSAIADDFRAKKGWTTPLQLHYDPTSGHASIGEGNHRLRAAEEAGESHVPVRMLPASRYVGGMPRSGFVPLSEHRPPPPAGDSYHPRHVLPERWLHPASRSADHTARRDDDLLGQLTFEHRPPTSDQPLHAIFARHPAGQPHVRFGENYAGHIMWQPEGEIAAVNVHEQFQRRGVATDLWDRAKRITPHLQHSEMQTREGAAWAQRTAMQLTAGIRMASPEEYRNFQIPDYSAKNPDALVKHFQKKSPEYYNKVKEDVRKNGFTTPVMVRWNDPRGKPLRKPKVMDGHHRLAIAHELGLHLPVGDYDNQEDYDVSFRAGQSWWRENQRPTGDMPGREAAVEHEVWYHGVRTPRQREYIRNNGLNPPSGVMPATWPMLTDSHEQAARYAGSGGSVLEYHVPKHLTDYRNEGAVLWPAKPHGAYGFDAQAVGVKGTLGNEHLVAEHPVSGNEHTAAAEVPCVRCRGTGKHPLADDMPKFFGNTPCPGCKGSKVESRATWAPTALPEHQEAALNEPDWQESKHKLLDIAKDRTPGTKVWRGEVRHKDDLDPKSVGLHWSATADQIVTPSEVDEKAGQHRVVYEGVIEHRDQAFPRNHPIWSGRHRSMDAEAEVRFKPGIQVRVTRRYVHDNSNGNTGFVPRYPERSSSAWQAHDMDRHVEVSHRPGQGVVDYSDVGIRSEGIRVPPEYHRERPETWGPDYHQYAAESPHGAAVGQAQEHLRLHVPAYETELPDSESEAGESLQFLLRHGGHPRADEAFVTRHRDPRRASSNVVYDPDDPEIPGVALHPSRWDYGTLAHEAAHILHHREIGRQRHAQTPDDVMHGPEFVDHFRRTLGLVHKHAPEELGKAYEAALERIRGSVGSRQAQAKVAPDTQQATARAAFVPKKRLFGPTHGLDKRLFDGEHLRPDVRRYILETLADFWKPKHGVGWDEWAMVYLAGSEASEWTSEMLEGNGDFDVLIGVDYAKYRGNSSRTDPAQEMTDEEITAELNADLRNLTVRTDPTWITVDGKKTGPWSNTWYVNQNSHDIRAIKPYAAYNVSKDEWAVKPPHLPTWDISQFPEGPALVAEAKAVASYVKAILNLPEPYRTQQGYALWHHLHSDRSRAFGPQGEGWYDPGNVIEKWLDQQGLWEKLVEIMVRVRNDPSTMDAPVDWSNNPHPVR